MFLTSKWKRKQIFEAYYSRARSLDNKRSLEAKNGKLAFKQLSVKFTTYERIRSLYGVWNENKL